MAMVVNEVTANSLPRLQRGNGRTVFSKEASLFVSQKELSTVTDWGTLQEESAPNSSPSTAPNASCTPLLIAKSMHLNATHL